MSQAVLVWKEFQCLRWAELREGASAMLGRSSKAAIKIGERTLSREQAIFSGLDGKFYVENLSRTNPTKVNRVTIENPIPLGDGDTIDAGLVMLVFHDLKSADRISGLICSHCSRENQNAALDCWYCGTSLVNAPTVIGRKVPLVCRIVSNDGTFHNLYDNEGFSVGPDGDGHVIRGDEVPSNAVVVLKIKDGVPRLTKVSAELSAMVNGEEFSSQQVLRTGDELGVGGGYFLCLVR